MLHNFSIYDLIALFISVPVHEYCHAWAATALGDPTPERHKRLSLNPISHFDLFGTILFLMAGFGWGKSVPVNPAYFHHWRIGNLLVSAIGPLSNFLLAIFFSFPIRVLADTGLQSGLLFSLTPLFSALVWWNLILGVFNLLPFPPLDGSKVVFSLLPERFFPFLHEYQQQGYLILAVLILDGYFGFGILRRILMPVLEFLWTLLT